MDRKLVFKNPLEYCNVSLLVLVKFFSSCLYCLPELCSDRTDFLLVVIEMLMSYLAVLIGKGFTVVDLHQFW